MSGIFLIADTLEYECSSWSASSDDGCVGDNWKSLDTTMNTTMTAICENLCLQQRERGCCVLGDNTGCHWNGRATPGVIPYPTHTSISVG